jgi:rubredoxin
MSTTAGTRRWLCEPCGEIYDPVEGDPESGIAPGTPFEEIPDGWLCPVCGARKSEFVPMDD